MTHDHDYFEWLSKGDRIRLTARAIIFNHARDLILVERGLNPGESFFNFPGGAIRTGEKMQSCIQRELREEINVRIDQVRYLFVVENFFLFDGRVMHGLDHFFEVMIDRQDFQTSNAGVRFSWMRIDQLSILDLRPKVVRDRIFDGTTDQMGHLTNDDTLM